MTEIVPGPVSWTLPAHSDIVRIPARPVAFRQPNFDERYDAETVFYDTFWVDRGRRALALGPAFANLRDAVAAARVTALPSGLRCSTRIVERDRHAQVWMEPPGDTRALRIASTLDDVTLDLRDNESDRFVGKRVIFTLSKNNRPEWIADWIRYYRDVHGADGVLLYDNGSTEYTLAALAEQLATVAGITTLVLVPWPFKYGAQGYGGLHWDSDYCQIGAMQDARWRFLQAAKSVLNVDIDELVVSRAGSVFDLVERSRTGYLTFFGEWVAGTRDRDERLRAREQSGDFVRHADFGHTLRISRTWKRHPKWRFPVPGYLNRCAPKWAVVPGRCPEAAQWTAHEIVGMPRSAPPLRQIGYRHFREINTGWKYDRSVRDAFVAKLHRRDAALADAFARVGWDG